MKFWNWINGYKSIIFAIIMKIVDSAYVESLIINPNAYELTQNIALLLFGGAVLHHVKKDMAKKKADAQAT